MAAKAVIVNIDFDTFPTCQIKLNFYVEYQFIEKVHILLHGGSHDIQYGYRGGHLENLFILICFLDCFSEQAEIFDISKVQM